MSRTKYEYHLLHEGLKENDELMRYLKQERHLNKETIEKHSLGLLKYNKQDWISIPLFEESGEFVDGYKLRIHPFKREIGYDKYIFSRKDIPVSCPFNTNNLDLNKSEIIICEGEFDCMLLDQLGYNVITSTTGANGFKESYYKFLEQFNEIILLLDNDEAGVSAAKNLGDKLALKYPAKVISIAHIPNEEGIKDVTEYFSKYGSITDVLREREKYKGIDVSKFKEIRIKDIKELLDPIIQEDDFNKVISFLVVVSTYTPGYQINVAMIGPSSTGKTYIVKNVTKILPKEDLKILQKVTKNAFFHLYDIKDYDRKTNTYTYNLDKICLFFTDLEQNDIIETLRTMLSHDEKELLNLITDKDEKGGNRTKNVVLRGFPTVFFCTTNTKTDPQEATRFVLLSPEISEKKNKMAIMNKIHKQKNEWDQDKLENIQERIFAIKQIGVKDIQYNKEQEKMLEEYVLKTFTFIPGDNRYYDKLIYIVYSICLLNLFTRDYKDGVLYTKNSDFEQAFQLWNEISITQKYSIPPYLIQVFKTIWLPLFSQKIEVGNDIKDVYLDKDEVLEKFSMIYNETPNYMEFKNMTSMFSSVTFIEIGNHSSDRRKLTFKLSEVGRKIYNNTKGG
jgi:5S rRNA maturation endonuclease (ribonuclease M5)